MNIEKKKWIGFILTLFASLSSHYSSSDQASLTPSPLSNLVQQPTITSIFTDQENFLWIGTQNGLYKFDGAKLSTFSSALGGKNWIPSSDISSITEDAGGNLFVSTYGGGLIHWDELSHSFKATNIAASDDQSNLIQALPYPAGYVWLRTPDMTTLLSTNPLVDTRWFSDHPLYNVLSRTSAIEALDSGDLIISNARSLFRVSIDERSITELEINLDLKSGRSRITAIAARNGREFFVGTSDGKVLSLDIDQSSILHSVDIGNGSTSASRLLYVEDTLWVGTNNGLYAFDGKSSPSRVFTEENSSLSNSEITHLHWDGKVIWVGTFQGLDTVSFVPINKLNKKNSGIFNDVMSFAEDYRGNLWVGTYGGLYQLNRDRNSHKIYDGGGNFPKLLDQRVMTLATKNKELWLGFRQGGVQIMDLETGDSSELRLAENVDIAVTKILHSQDGQTWIATYNAGLFRVSEDQHIVSFLSQSLLEEVSPIILLDLGSEGILVATEKHAYKYSRALNHFTRLNLQFPNDVDDPTFYTINRDDYDNIWIGTKAHGLFFWSKQHQSSGNMQVKNNTAEHQLHHSSIYAIEFDKEQNAWCSTSSGLIQTNSDGAILTKLTAADGLQGSDFNFAASFTDSIGNFYFGGANGYNTFDPALVKTNNLPSPMSMIDIDYSGREPNTLFKASELQTLYLRHNNHLVAFTFSILDFLNPQKNQYRYKLEGFDPEWIDNGARNTATYTNLPAGKYVLRVQGANSAGVWNREGLSLKVIMLPAPWYTWWAYTIYGLLLSILIWLLKRAYDSYAIEARATERAKEMNDMADKADDDLHEQIELHDDLVKSAYGHNLTTLHLISDCIAVQGEHLPDEASRKTVSSSIVRVNALAALEQCLYFQDGELLADLSKYTNILTDLLLDRAPVPPESITTINDVDAQLIPAETASCLAVIIYELFSNSIEHAFDEDSLANYIRISFGANPESNSPNDRYRLSISDNGTSTNDNPEMEGAETSGLAIVNRMVERLSGSLRYSVVDGTAVTLVFPDWRAG